MAEIRKSLINDAGNGVFATKDFKKGDYICFYDGEDREIKTFEDFTYALRNPITHKTHIGYSKQKSEDGIGQFINDCSMFSLHDKYKNELGFFSLSNKFIDYDINSYNLTKKNCNCCFNNEKGEFKFKFYANKDIKKGEELYFHYGIDHWLSKYNLENRNKPLVSLFCILKQGILQVKNDKFYLNGIEVSAKSRLEQLLITPECNIIKYFNLEKFSDKEKLLEIIKIITK